MGRLAPTSPCCSCTAAHVSTCIESRNAGTVESRGMRVRLLVEAQEGVSWDQWMALASAVEHSGFEALFTSDHYATSLGNEDQPGLDAWTLLAAIGARTERIRLGTLVTPVTFRHPVVLAKAIATVD